MGIGFDDLKIVPGVASGLSSGVRLFTFKTELTPSLSENQSGQIAAPVRSCLLGRLLGLFVIHVGYQGWPLLSAASFPSCQLARGPRVAVATVLHYNYTNNI